MQSVVQYLIWSYDNNVSMAPKKPLSPRVFVVAAVADVLLLLVGES